MEAWGEIFTVPSDKGDIRNLTRTPVVAERDPAWSPDGKWVAYFSEASGEYNLEIRDQSGLGDAKKINLGNPPSFFYSPQWSPDGQKIAYSDKRLNLWYVDLAKGAPVKVDVDYYEGASFNVRWAPDSRWLVYTKQLPSFLHVVWVYSLEQGKSFQVTDGMSDALYATFDASGKYLYFAASTDVGPSAEGFDMSSNNRPQTRSVYAVVLAKDQASPLAPESDEEKGGAEKKDEKNKPKKEEPPAVRIDFEGISQRILALPIPAKNYVNLLPGKSGILFIAEAPQVITQADYPNLPQTLYKWDLEKRKLDKFVEDLNDFTVSFNGEKLLYRKGEQWVMTRTDEAAAAGAEKGEGRTAGRRLRAGERALPDHQGVRRGKLESGAAGAVDAARSECKGRRLPAGGQRTGAALLRQPVQLLRGDGRQTGGAEGGPVRRRERVTGCDGCSRRE